MSSLDIIVERFKCSLSEDIEYNPCDKQVMIESALHQVSGYITFYVDPNLLDKRDILVWFRSVELFMYTVRNTDWEDEDFLNEACKALRIAICHTQKSIP